MGPAFDALGVALGLHLDVYEPERGAGDAETHPAVRAFRSAGGTGPIEVSSGFPGGRGLGFSGAATVGGLLAAAAQQGRPVGEVRERVLRDAASVEGHADNVAASIYGGVVAVAGGEVVTVPLARRPAIVLWLPAAETPTRSSRRLLPASVPFEDAVFNVGRTALLVAALAAGAVEALRTATEDRLHQDRRLERVPATGEAIRAAMSAGAWGAWLSGSGPSAAAFVDPERADVVTRALPEHGRTIVVPIDDEGATIT
jgi:homoserine kinase